VTSSGLSLLLLLRLLVHLLALPVPLAMLTFILLFAFRLCRVGVSFIGVGLPLLLLLLLLPQWVLAEDVRAPKKVVGRLGRCDALLPTAQGQRRPAPNHILRLALCSESHQKPRFVIFIFLN
jgi:hypothetical protein